MNPLGLLVKHGNSGGRSRQHVNWLTSKIGCCFLTKTSTKKKADKKINASVCSLIQFSHCWKLKCQKLHFQYLRSRDMPKFVWEHEMRSTQTASESAKILLWEHIFHEDIQMEAENQDCVQFLIRSLSLYTLDKPIYLLYKKSKSSLKVIYYCYLHQWHGCCEVNVGSTLENPGMKGTA